MRATARLFAAALTGGLLLVLALSTWASPSEASPPDTTYTAVAPCVVFDSRVTQGATGGFLGPINGGQAVTEQVTGTFPAGQGGGNTTCGIPVGAASVEINVVAINALNEGNLRVTDGTPTTSGGAVNYNNLTPKLNTANAVIVPLDATGQLVVTPNCGGGCTADSTDIRGIVLGYFSDSLAIRLAAVEAKLQDVTRIPAGIGGQPTVQFSGVNVQIVDGTGDTGCDDANTTFYEPCNGRGNLIVGYAENPFGPRTGAHNIVGGEGNSWTSFGGAVFGVFNTIGDDYATVTGGYSNVADGRYSMVTGGDDNHAQGQTSVVAGGYGALASGTSATVSGGSGNSATGDASTVSGGRDNTASQAQCTNLGYSASSVSGGEGNIASGCSASASGGRTSEAYGAYSSVSGGIANLAYGENSSISGGYSGVAIGLTSSISGGYDHTVNGPDDWQGGGLFQDS